MKRKLQVEISITGRCWVEIEADLTDQEIREALAGHGAGYERVVEEADNEITLSDLYESQAIEINTHPLINNTSMFAGILDRAMVRIR